MDKNSLADKIGCTRAWVDLGIVDDQIAQEIESGEIVVDRSDPEHARYRLLCGFLGRQAGLSDKQVDMLLEIALAELQSGHKDSLGASVYHDLIKTPYLTDSQFNKVAGSFIDKSFDRIVTRFRFIRALSGGDARKSTIKEALFSGDGHVHKFLLDKNLLDASQLAWMSKSGGNRAVRNRAKSMRR